MLLAPALLLAQLAGGGAWSTGRPPECGEPGGRAANVWERAKSPELRLYCDKVASAASKLAGTAAMAEQALAAAREADRLLPGHAAPRVLAGRALEALGQLPEALVELEAGRALEPRALDDPRALLAYARALARTGQPARAADAYRALLPRAASISAHERSVASLEAGLVALGRGPARLDEAVAALRTGLREAQDDLRPVAALALALALDRGGDTEEAGALLAAHAHGDPRTALATPAARELLVVAPAEAHALAALGLESTDAAGARDEWQACVDAAPQGPWAAAARARKAALARGPAAARRAR